MKLAIFGASGRSGKHLVVKVLLRHVYEDMKRTVDVVRGSNVDWTIVRVPVLTDRPATDFHSWWCPHS